VQSPIKAPDESNKHKLYLLTLNTWHPLSAFESEKKAKNLQTTKNVNNKIKKASHPTSTPKKFMSKIFFKMKKYNPRPQ
jgi:hypothetical protein